MGVKITGLGSYIPTEIITNDHFKNHRFFDATGNALKHPAEVILKKFTAITGINERRYATKLENTSDLAFMAAKQAINHANINPETLDYIIVSHNYGDVNYGSSQSDIMPALAARVKQKLQIQNPKCVAYDLIFGCPGWIEGVIQANSFINSGIAQRCLVIGAETLSRVVDKHDRDSMIFADGAGACILEKTENTGGIISHTTATYANEEADFLYNQTSYKNDEDDRKFIKMDGRKIYEFALTKVPAAMKECLDKSGIPVEKISKILLHQANEKMDEAIVQRFYKLFDKEAPGNVMPMCIDKLGNSSVATVPTLFDLIVKDNLAPHQINKGDYLILASVGAGMNINAIVYQY